MARMKSGVAPYMGFEKDAPSVHGPKVAGKTLVHSHGMKPKRKIHARSGHKRMTK